MEQAVNRAEGYRAASALEQVMQADDWTLEVRRMQQTAAQQVQQTQRFRAALAELFRETSQAAEFPGDPDAPFGG